MASNKQVDLWKIENSGTVILKKHLFSEQKWNVFEMKNQGLGEIKPRFSLWLKLNFRKIASNKHVDLRKIIVDGHLTYKGKKR